MRWAVHWLQGEFLPFDIEDKHVLLVVLPMARGCPKGFVIKQWRYDFIIASFPVFLPDKIQKLIVYDGSFWIKKWRPWAFLKEIIPLKLFPYLSVVTFFCFFNQLQMGFEH